MPRISPEILCTVGSIPIRPFRLLRCDEPECYLLSKEGTGLDWTFLSNFPQAQSSKRSITLRAKACNLN